MSEDVTVEISGTEFNADHLEAAIEKFSDDVGHIDLREGAVGVWKTVGIWGDSFDDADCYITPTSNVISVTDDTIKTDDIDKVAYMNANDIQSMIDEVRGVDAVEYVDSITSLLNGVESGDEYFDNNTEDVDVVITCDGFVGSEIEELVYGEGIEIESISTQKQNEVHIALYVDEEVATT